MTIETLEVTRAFQPLDLLLFQRFKREVPGLLEQSLAGNPGLSTLGVFLPIGTRVRVEVPAPASRPGTRPLITLWE